MNEGKILVINGAAMSHDQMLRIARLADASGVRNASSLVSVLTLSGLILADLETVESLEPLAESTMLILGELLSPESDSREADKWNQEHPIGTWVTYPDSVANEAYISRTISAALCSDYAEPIVLLENCDTPILLSLISPVSKAVATQMAREASGD